MLRDTSKSINEYFSLKYIKTHFYIPVKNSLIVSSGDKKAGSFLPERINIAIQWGNAVSTLATGSGIVRIFITNIIKRQCVFVRWKIQKVLNQFKTLFH